MKKTTTLRILDNLGTIVNIISFDVHIEHSCLNKLKNLTFIDRVGKIFKNNDLLIYKHLDKYIETGQYHYLAHKVETFPQSWLSGNTVPMIDHKEKNSFKEGVVGGGSDSCTVCSAAANAIVGGMGWRGGQPCKFQCESAKCVCECRDIIPGMCGHRGSGQGLCACAQKPNPTGAPTT